MVSFIVDHLSLRHTRDGTFFVQEFVKVLAEEAHMYDFQTMLAEVRKWFCLLTLRKPVGMEP